MNINEVATYLKLSREEVKVAIEKGIELPISKALTYLKAHQVGKTYDIDERDLDEFISKFEAEDPGRNPPTAVRRELLIEARHGCAICGEKALIEYHHIIDFSSIGHYDTKHMLALCPTDHGLCTIGKIDKKAQYEYKRKLTTEANKENSQFIYSIGPANFSWDDLRTIITSLHESIVKNSPNEGSKFDFSEIDIERKNELNRVGEEYYNTVITVHEPYFGRIQEFLHNPISSEIVELYYQIVDEIRTKIAASRDESERFEFFLNTFTDTAVANQENGRSKNRRTLNILMSFMYVNCDIGRKK